MNQYYRDLIATEFRNCVRGTIERIKGNEQTYRPFHTALLSDDVVFWSAFERSFSTSFGQRVIEEIALLVARSNGATEAKRQFETVVHIDVAYENAINQELRMLRERHSSFSTSWNHTLQRVLQTNISGQIMDIRVISDLWWCKDGIDNYISLKTVKPNIDQTLVAKQDCLRLAVNNPNCNVYFGLPYNPYGEFKDDYAHNPPMRIFDFHHDSIVLIGKDMWETIGGVGCYDELLDIAEEVGEGTRWRIGNLR